MTQLPSSLTGAAHPSSQGLLKGYLAALTIAGALYLASAAPGSLWQDSGMAQNRTLQKDLTGSLGLALSHPSIIF